mgnify:CR=1 FL=1
MRFYLLFSLLLALGASAAPASDDVQRCDTAAGWLDPLRPATVPAHYYQASLADRNALHEALEPCRRAWEASGEPRYAYQAGRLIQGFLRDAALRRSSPVPTLDERLLAATARDYLQKAAKAGYATATATLLSFPTPTKSAADFDELLAQHPALGHGALANWYGLQAQLEPAQKEHWQTLAREQWQRAAEAETPERAWWPRAQRLALEEDIFGLRTLLKAQLEKEPHCWPARELLLELYHKAAIEAEAQTLLEPVAQWAAAGDPDAQVFQHYLNGLRQLDGWGVPQDKAAAKMELKAAARGGHERAKIYLNSRYESW